MTDILASRDWCKPAIEVVRKRDPEAAKVR